MQIRVFRVYLKEEIIVPLLIFIVMGIAFSPFLLETVLISHSLPSGRYPLIETEFPPDQRVYLSRMRLGYEGKWLVEEKFTSEPHRPTLLHEGYLLMGKLAGWVGLDPVQAFPIWRLIGGAFLLGSGYFLLLKLFPERKYRLAAFILFIFAGNLPLLKEWGIPFLGGHFSFILGWFTFFDPVKRLVFLPHYTFTAGFLNLALADILSKDYHRAGIWAFLSGIFLPQSLRVVVFIAGICDLLNVKQYKKIIRQRWLFWALVIACFMLFKLSISSFPWNLQLPADAGKRELVPFNLKEVLLSLGPTGVFGFLGAFYIIGWCRKRYYAVSFWLVAIVFFVVVSSITPISNQWRFMQVDLHLPLAAATVVLLADIVAKIVRQKNWLFFLLIAFLLLPSLIVWPVSLKSSQMFARAKVEAGYPSIPKLPYVVYPVKTVMEGVFWLKTNTNHQDVVLAAETLGSMIPAYSGNIVYLGHGNQTAFFDQKIQLMTRFYRREMALDEQGNFLSLNRIKFVFWGPEEQEISGGREPVGLSTIVFRNTDVIIYQWVR